jgi:hypothetical protein
MTRKFLVLAAIVILALLVSGSAQKPDTKPDQQVAPATTKVVKTDTKRAPCETTLEEIRPDGTRIKVASDPCGLTTLTIPPKLRFARVEEVNTPVADKVSFCREAMQVFDHPEQYVIETVTQRDWRGLAVCAAHASCCLPGWELDPICYAENVISRDRKKVADAWKETVHYFMCEDITPKEAVQRFVAKTKPDSFPGKILNLKPAVAFLGSLVAVAKGRAVPFQADLRAELIDRLTRTSRVEHGDFPEGDFPNRNTVEAVVTQTVWIRYDDPAAAPLWKFAGDANAITFDNMIVAGPGLLNMTGCALVAGWAHEVVHVNQYRVIGFNEFIEKYLANGFVNGYCGVPAESDAYGYQDQVLAQCTLPKSVCRNR